MKHLLSLFAFSIFSNLSFASPAPLEIRTACVCENGKSLSLPSCKSLCMNDTISSRTLHLYVVPSSETLLSDQYRAYTGEFADVLSFCTTSHDQTTNPSCQLIVVDEAGTAQRIPFIYPAKGVSHIKVSISALKASVPYQVYIQEITSAKKSTEWTLNFRPF